MADPLLESARRSLRHGSKSFALASRLFDRQTRTRATLLYAWCRHCDDVIDGQWLGEGRRDWGGTPAVRLAQLRQFTDSALAGQPPADEPAFAALARLVDEVDLPAVHVRALLHGFAIDVAGGGIADEAALLSYCYHVAGCVGVMMAIAMGVNDRATLLRASDLGVALQLANIARDVAEDAARGRCYLPHNWLAEAGLPPPHGAGPAGLSAYHPLVCRLVDLAGRYEASGVQGAAQLGRRQAWAVLAAARIYGAIGREVVRREPDALNRRVVISGPRKWLAIVQAGALVAIRRKPADSTADDRAGLWTPDWA